jgi:hypothetical protein
VAKNRIGARANAVTGRRSDDDARRELENMLSGRDIVCVSGVVIVYIDLLTHSYALDSDQRTAILPYDSSVALLHQANHLLVNPHVC